MSEQYITGEEIKRVVEYLAKCKEGCFHNTITNKDGYDIAIVIGWTAFDDTDDKDKYFDDNHRLAIKVAYQSDKSFMQCDYDVDWLLPYYSNGEVFDSEYILYENTNFDAVAKDINFDADDMLKQWKKFERN